MSLHRAIWIAVAVLVATFTAATLLGQQNTLDSLNVDGMTKKDQSLTHRAYKCAYKEEVGSKSGFICAVIFAKQVEKYEELNFKTVLQEDSNEAAKTKAKSLIQMHVDQMLMDAIHKEHKQISKCMREGKDGNILSCVIGVNSKQKHIRLVNHYLGPLNLFSREEIKEYIRTSVKEYIRAAEASKM